MVKFGMPLFEKLNLMTVIIGLQAAAAGKF